MNPTLVFAAVKAAATVAASLASVYASITLARRLKDPATPLYVASAKTIAAD